MIETKVIEWTPAPGMDDATQFAALYAEIENQAFGGWWSGGAFKVAGVWKLVFQRDRAS